MGEVDLYEKALKILIDLSQRESLSKKEEETRNYLRRYLERLGYKVEEGEYYLFVQGKSDFLVATHIDTIPQRRPLDIKNNTIYGTGVCDAKASVTAILLTAEKGIEYSLAFFCDEEEDGLGSKEFVRKHREPRQVIIMEPTELRIASYHWGSFELYLEVIGKEAHGAYPQRGLNAIDQAFQLYKLLKELGLNFNPLKITGGSDLYVIPERCELKLEVFLRPGERIMDYLEKLEVLHRWARYRIDHAYEGYISKEVHKILEKALQRCGLNVEYGEMRSWTDALNLKEIADVVVWGPGELELCHTREEKVCITDILCASKVLEYLNSLVTKK